MGAVLKVLLTLFVVLVAYWLIKYRGRISVLKAAVKAAKKTATEAARADDPASEAAQKSVPMKLVACPKCGTYGAEGKPCACGA